MEKLQIHSTLGISWDPVKDTFLFAFKAEQKFSTYTKRAILSLTASVFDPLGLISPLVLIPRVLLQDLWLQKSDWDSKVPENIKTSFIKCLDDLNNINTISIRRFVLDDNYTKLELHGFCDASIRAYGCCFYICARNMYNSKTTLFAAKCRVAPTKKRTIPQLELCGAHLLSVFYRKIAPLLKTF